MNEVAQSPQRMPLKDTTLRRGEMMWYSPQWYQIHLLRNVGCDVTVALHGCAYGPEDNVHWPYIKLQVRITGSQLGLELCGLL